MNAQTVAGDGNWTDPAQWINRTVLGNIIVAGTVPDNYDLTASGFIGTNVAGGPRARYFDVVMNAAGTKTIQSGEDIEVDTLRLNHAGTTVLVSNGASLTALLDEAPINTPGITYAGILLDQGTIDGDGSISTPIFTQNGGLASISGSLVADNDIFLNGGTLANEGVGTVQTTRFRQVGGILDPGPEINLDPVTAALLPGQDVDSFISATFSAIAVGGSVNAIGNDGIDVTGGGGANDVVVKTSSTDGLSSNSDISAAGAGILVNNDFAGASGDIVIDIDGLVQSATSDAIRVQAGQSSGAVSINGSGRVAGGPNPGNDGIDVVNGGNVFVGVNGLITGDPGINILSFGGNITVLGVGDVIGNPNEGILAKTIFGNGDVLIARDGNITGSRGIVAESSNGGIGTGSVTVGVFPGRTVLGTTGPAIDADTDLGPINIDIDGNAISNFSAGVWASSLGGAIDIDGAGTVTGGFIGIIATTGGDIFIDELAAVTGLTSDGIFATSGGGDIRVGTTASLGPVVGATDGIDLTTGGTGGITLLTFADVTGGTGFGIQAVAGSGGTGIFIDGGVTVTAASENAVLFSGSAGSLNLLANEGFVVGSITGGIGDETFVNAASGFWAPSALNAGFSLNAFDGGTDAIGNAGTLVAYDVTGPNLTPTIVSITGLETFTNAGTITMQNGQGAASLTSDRIFISSETAVHYDGLDGVLAVDSFLGAHPAPGDLLTLGVAGGTEGSTSGNTFIQVNDTDTGVGVFNPIGVEVVRVESAVAGANTQASHFTLAGGPIEKGLWVWDLGLDDTRINPGRATADVHVLYSRPSDIVQFTPYFGTAAITAFHASLEPWLDRQQTLAASVSRSPGWYHDFWITPYGMRRVEDSISSLTFFNKTFMEQMDYSQSVGGVQGGLDLVLVRSSGATVMLGAFGGFVDSNIEPDAVSVLGEFRGGTVGLYANLVHGDFHVSAVGKLDIMDFDWSSPSLGESAASEVDVAGTRIEAAYRWYGLGAASWLEPYINLTYAGSYWDPFSVLGTVFDIDDNDSLMGRLGSRVHTTLSGPGTMQTQLYLGAGLVHEFHETNTAQIHSGGFSLPLEHEVDATGLELQGGISLYHGSGLSLLITSSGRVYDNAFEYGGRVTLNFQF